MNKFVRSLVTATLALALALPVAATAPAPEATSIAILNFDNQSQDKAAAASHAWLRKGLADLLINDLATLPTLRVMTREQMQMLLQEARLQEGLLGAVPPAEAEKMRRYFAVDLIVRGAYALDGDTLTLQASLLRQRDSAAVARFTEKAPLADALAAQKALARQLLGHLAGATPAEIAAWPLPQWTASTSAAQLLYEGVDLFDQGDYLRAWHSFRQAQRRDPAYADAAYWIARMHYYRTDYAHARPAYDAFINRFPNHGRIGDAVMELIHSAERLSDSPAAMLALYEKFQQGDWREVKVYNQIDHLSHSPLADWLAKRQQGALAYLERYDEAYQVLVHNLADNPTTNATELAWQNQAKDLLANLAMFAEDGGRARLSADAAPYRDIQLTLEKPFMREDLAPFGLRGQIYKWGNNYRLLAPAGHRFKKLKAEIWRTNDPECKSVCRLQVRRYRYVDINTCWTEDNDQTPGKRYTFDINMPPNATWLLLRPEYDGASGNPPRRMPHNGSFDAWRIDAEFEPLHPRSGGIELRVRNAMEFNAIVDGAYTRGRNGTIGNLAPGTHTITINDMFNRKQWGFEPLQTTFEVLPGQYLPMELKLEPSTVSLERGWQRPSGVALDYPTYKHSPRRLQNWRDGAPTYAVDPAGGERAVVWSHLDDLWLATSTNGTDWTPPVNLPAPVNSAHVELNPRLIATAAGGYALLFLSDRGQQRSLGLYATLSHDLQQWTRPLLVSPEHHTDLAFMQARDGTFIVLTVPGEKDVRYLELRTSRDLVDWSAPRRLPLITTATAIDLVQDDSGMFHLLWLGTYSEERPYRINYACIHHMRSPDLLNWSRPAQLPHDKRFVISVTAAVSDQRLWCAIGTVDEYYAGQARLTLLGRHLSAPGAAWEEWELPDGLLSGLTSLTADPLKQQIVFAWSMTDMQLNAGRFSGPVFAMAGTPAIARPPRGRPHRAIPHSIALRFAADAPPDTCDARTALDLRPQPAPINLTPKKSLRNDLANAAFAATAPAVKIPEPLRHLQWGLLQETPHPSTRLERLTAHNLTATAQSLSRPLDISGDNLRAIRERRAVTLYCRGQAPHTFALGTPANASRLGISLTFSTLWRSPDNSYFIFALTDEATERHYASSAEAPPAPLGRQLVFFSNYFDAKKVSELGIAANSAKLVTWRDNKFFEEEHTLHFIQYDNIGELFLDQQRLAVIPLDHPAQRPILMLQALQTDVAINQIELWELND